MTAPHLQGVAELPRVPPEMVGASIREDALPRCAVCDSAATTLLVLDIPPHRGGGAEPIGRLCEQCNADPTGPLVWPTVVWLTLAARGRVLARNGGAA